MSYRENYGTTLPEDERKIQIEEARRLSGVQTRSTAPQSHRGPRQAKPTEVKTLKGHEAFLDALRANGTRCRFKLSGGESIEGKIHTMDATTVSVIGESGLPVVIVKSNMQYFTPLHAAKKPE